MCNILHTGIGALSVQPPPCGSVRVLHILRVITPVSSWQRLAETGQNPHHCRFAGRRRKYTTSRECKPLSSRPTQAFGDLASSTQETAHLTHCNKNRMRSPGWNGRNLPAQNEVLWNLTELSDRFLFVKTRPDSLCGPEVQF
jgi:hypothetical protein